MWGYDAVLDWPPFQKKRTKYIKLLESGWIGKVQEEIEMINSNINLREKAIENNPIVCRCRVLQYCKLLWISNQIAIDNILFSRTDDKERRKYMTC